jgi:integral membrane protein
MAAMTRAFDLRSVAGWLRLVGLLEAVSWVGLLVGMYFKYVASPSTEIGVKIFGPIHGGVFIGFVVAAVAAGVAFRWGVTTWLLALLASVVPLATVIFLIWADRTGRMGPAAASAAASAPISQPGRTAPETT